jgi:hypothetical protein
VRKDARPDYAKMRPLTLYGWEGAKFVTPVREALNELGRCQAVVCITCITTIDTIILNIHTYDAYKYLILTSLAYIGLAHVFVPCANGSQNRDKLSSLTKGVMQVPYLVNSVAHCVLYT